MWKMDPKSGFDIRLVFTLPPRDSTLQYKKCVHLWNNFPCNSTLVPTDCSQTQILNPRCKFQELKNLNLKLTDTDNGFINLLTEAEKKYLGVAFIVPKMKRLRHRCRCRALCLGLGNFPITNDRFLKIKRRFH